MLDRVKISTSKKIESKDRNPSWMMVSRLRICEREFTRDLFPIVDTLTSITAYRRTFKRALPYSVYNRLTHEDRVHCSLNHFVCLIPVAFAIELRRTRSPSAFN